MPKESGWCVHWGMADGGGIWTARQQFTSIYDLGWGALDGSTDTGGDEDLTANNILIISNNSEITLI